MESRENFWRETRILAKKELRERIERYLSSGDIVEAIRLQEEYELRFDEEYE